MKDQTGKYSSILFVVALLFILWGILGIVDSKNFTYSGYSTDGDNTIIKVEDNSPAAHAGFQVGDEIKKTGGISVTDSKALSKRGRAKIGETREYIVERAGNELSLQLTFSAISSKDKTLNIVAFIIGLLFVLAGVYAYNTIGTALSLSFAIFVLCFGYTFMYGPYFNDELLRKIVDVFSTTVVLFSFAILVKFILMYPPKSNFLTRKNSLFWLYTPAVAVIVFIWVLIFLQPDSTSSLNQITRLVFGVFIVGYFGLALLTLIIKYIRANSDERKATGLNLILTGTIIGLVPILIYFSIQTISPKTILPGQDYIFLSFVAIPLFCTLALVKQKKETLSS